MGSLKNTVAGLAIALAIAFPVVVMADPDLATNSTTPYVFQTTDGKCAIAIDTSTAPELANWAQHQLAPVLAAWYPKIIALLPSKGFAAPAGYTITIRKIDGVAYTTGTNVFVSEKWIQDEMNGEAIGSLVHESVHVVQQYRNARAPSWLVEGMADYVRWFKYQPQSHGADIVWMRTQGPNFSPHYNGSYRISANFLNWVTTTCDPNIVTEVNATLREGMYNRDFWKRHTGKTLQELGDKWKEQIEVKLGPADSAKPLN
jgi:hypothetical protein